MFSPAGDFSPAFLPPFWNKYVSYSLLPSRKGDIKDLDWPESYHTQVIQPSLIQVLASKDSGLEDMSMSALFTGAVLVPKEKLTMKMLADLLMKQGK